jgi:hypothetical protein
MASIAEHKYSNEHQMFVSTAKIQEYAKLHEQHTEIAYIEASGTTY